MEQILNEAEIRILGCLIEKQLSTPEYYPLSLNALKNACNQKSNRNPVVAYDDETVSHTIKGLQSKGLVVLSSEPGQRTRKYHHRFPEKYAVTQKETILLCTLMLRGPQTPGEIRTHTDRMSGFSSPEEVSHSLDELMNERDVPLVIQLPRLAGHKEHRYMHLLAGEPEIPEDLIAHSEAHRSGGNQTTVRLQKLEEEVDSLKAELEALKHALEDFRSQFE